jgi:hypothetical protein
VLHDGQSLSLKRRMMRMRRMRMNQMRRFLILRILNKTECTIPADNLVNLEETNVDD